MPYDPAQSAKPDYIRREYDVERHFTSYPAGRVTTAEIIVSLIVFGGIGGFLVWAIIAALREAFQHAV